MEPISPGQHENYTQIVESAFTTAKLDSDEELGIEDFFAELVQNSLDHNHGDTTRPIEIEVQEIEGGGFSYAHNGVRFGFEPESRSEDSTLTGVFKEFSDLKKYDFRIGRFGIGFKLWMKFFKTLKLESIHNRKSFSIDFDISSGKIVRKFEYEDTAKDDTTMFEFQNPKVSAR